ncbi:MAG: prenyltransferase/squalene oxidase repeat-containing protein [Pirellulales bacterium]
MSNRRCFIAGGIGSMFALSQLPAQVEERTKAADLITPATKTAINQGLQYIAARQIKQGQAKGAFGVSGYRANTAVSALAGMAFMANGSTPGRGPFGKHINDCIDYLLANTQEGGFVAVPGSSTHGPMYGHGFATLFLAEVYGMSASDEVREKLQAAIKLIIDTQNVDGGWRYEPQRNEADLSVTVCQMMALRAARNAGIYVPNETVERCIDYVKRSQNADGGFMYMLNGGASAFPRSAAGVVALYSAGVYKGTEIENGLEYLMGNLPQNQGFRGNSHFFYGQYYAAQAFYHAGGSHWNRYYPKIRDFLLSRQSTGGSWQDFICDEYGTTMACIVLQMPNNYLPIFQK